MRSSGCFFIIPSLMLVNVVQHRWAVGNFNSHFNLHKLKSKSDSLLGICSLLKKLVHVLMLYIISHVVPGLLTFLDSLLTGKFRRNFWFYIKKIILSGDVETNPGPQSKRCQESSICHWNLNSVATHSFIKVHS